jgi:hypothetical protein
VIWVESTGGPLLLMEQTALPAWSGAEEDYERVCTVEDLIGAIAVGEAAQALVMGDEPAGTTFIPALGVFVQWLYGEHGTDVVATVEASLPTADWDAGAMEDTDSPDQQATEYVRTENGASGEDASGPLLGRVGRHRARPKHLPAPAPPHASPIRAAEHTRNGAHTTGPQQPTPPQVRPTIFLRCSTALGAGCAVPAGQV